MIQFPININDASNAHKPQELSRDMIIIKIWSKECDLGTQEKRSKYDLSIVWKIEVIDN